MKYLMLVIFFKKTDYGAEILYIKSKYFTAADYNRLINEKLDLIIRQKKSFDKSDIADLVKNAELYKKVAILATKAELKAEKDKIIKLQAFDSSYFCGKSYFEDDGTQNYLVFQTIYKYFKKIGNTDHISAWKSKGLSDKNINPPPTSDDSLFTKLRLCNFLIIKRFIK